MTITKGSGLRPTINQSTEHREWEIGGLKFTELCRQVYAVNNCVFAAGSVEGHPVDTVYLSYEKDSEPVTFLLLRPDEALAIAWVLTGTVWSGQIAELPEEPGAAQVEAE